jgi:hypothetical protein
MTDHSRTHAAGDRHGRSPWHALLAGLVSLAFALNVVAQAPAAPGGAAPPLSPEDLENIVGPIALYPDDLVAIILPASTFPLEIVQADRFLDKRKADPKLPVPENWDDSVKALVNYPDVVKKMSTDLDWTSALGEAVVADQGAVMEAIQAFRRKTQSVGNLKSDDKQTVVVEKEIITIVPANPEVIYVPQYNPTTVVVSGGYSGWGYWPAPYPVYYYPYPPGAALATGLIWGAALGAAWSGNHWNTNWGGNNVNINRNTNINTGNINRGNINTGNRPSQGGGSAWKSDKRPGQVSSGAGRPSNTSRVGDARSGGGGGFGASGAGAGAGRPSPQTGGGGMGGAATSRPGTVSASPRDNFGGSSANRGGSGGGGFSGYGSGNSARADSSRGASSRSSMGGGASRGGGGGGGGRGGGGGGRGGGGRR